MFKYISQYRQLLIQWYEINKRSLPWRNVDDPYRIWLSEVMLQQTQVNTVLPYYEDFLKLFPTMDHLCHAEEDKILKVWEGLGYYQRIRNFHKAIIIVMSKFQGNIPESYGEFIELPGVGPYMASAVMSLAFNQPYAVVDGNVKRVLSRLLKIDYPINKPGSQKFFQKYADHLLKKRNPGTYNQAIMELGAKICRPRSPDCRHCPVQKFCLAFSTDKVEEYPKKVKRNKIRQIEKIAFIPNDQRYEFWLKKRQNTRLLEGLWELPMIEIELLHDNNLKDDPLVKVEHTYSHFIEIVSVYPVASIPEVYKEKNKLKLINYSDLHKYPITGISKKILILLGSKYPEIESILFENPKMVADN